MANTIEELQSLSYRDLQAECKKQGISAKGKAEELLGKLILNLQKTNPNVKSPGATPQPAKKTAGRRSAAAAAAAAPSSFPTPSPSPARKSIDKKVMRKAINTPLPVSPSKPGTSKAAAAAVPKARSFSPSWPVTILALLLALSLYVPLGLKYCEQNDCIGRFHKATNGKIEGAWKDVGGVGKELVFAMKDLSRRVKWGAGMMAHDMNAKLKGLMEKVRASSGIAVSSPPVAFNGELNSAVLSSVLRNNEGDAWEELQLFLAEAWSGGKIAADQHKANVILFLCGSTARCASAMDELSVAAPVASTLVLSSGELAAGKGELQTRLAHFLKGHPRGVILVPAVDKVPLHALSVLNHVMGEYGALTWNGVNIPSSDATFLLTWQAPPAILAEDSETSFSLAAKKDLTLLLRGDAPDEKVQALVDAFRRRIDLVAPVSE